MAEFIEKHINPITTMKITQSIIFLLLFLICKLAFPAHVPEKTAQTVAFNFLKTVEGNVTNSPLSLVYSDTSETQPLYYVFGNETGFVILAGDDRIGPILLTILPKTPLMNGFSTLKMGILKKAAAPKDWPKCVRSSLPTG